MNKQHLARRASKIAEDGKGQDITVLDIQDSSFADYFVIVTGLNKVHTRAIADDVETELAKEGVTLYSKQGYQQGEWIVLDYLDFVVHVFVRDVREFYQLERLWQYGNDHSV